MSLRKVLRKLKCLKSQTLKKKPFRKYNLHRFSNRTYQKIFFSKQLVKKIDELTLQIKNAQFNEDFKYEYSQRIINANLNGNIQFHDIRIKEHKIDILRFLTCKVLCFVLVRLESLTLHQNIFGIHEMSQATLTYTLLYVPTLVTIDSLII